MKKSLIMLLAAMMLLLTACGAAPFAEGLLSAFSTQPTGSEQVSTPVQTDSPSQSVRPDSTQPPEPFEPTAAVEQTVLVDECGVKITATGIKYTAYAVKLSLTIENNTDRDLSFYAYDYKSVNGYMVDDGYLNASVAHGKRANETISFDVNELKMLGITDIADIELGFDIYEDLLSDYLVTGPRQLKTSLADSYDYAADTYRQTITDSGVTDRIGFSVLCDSEEIPFDQRGVRVVSQTLVKNSSGESALLVEVENALDDMVYVSVGDVAINGLGVESGTWSADLVGAGKRRVISIPLSRMLDDSYREVFGLEEIGLVSYALGVKDIDRDTLVVPATLTLAVPGSNASYDASGEVAYWEKGVRIVTKGLASDSFEYSDDIHVLLLVENGSSGNLTFDVDYDSVSVNGYMTSFICFSRQAAPGGSVVLDVELMGYSLENNRIAGLEDITEVELTVEIRSDNYKTVAEPVVTINIEG